MNRRVLTPVVFTGWLLGFAAVAEAGPPKPGLWDQWRGPTRDGRQKPDITAPGTAIGSATTFDISQSCAPGGSLRMVSTQEHSVRSSTRRGSPGRIASTCRSRSNAC